MGAFDEDGQTHAAARGDECAQLALALFYLNKARGAQNVMQSIHLTQLAGTFAMLAAAQGTVPAVRIYAFALRARIACGHLTEKSTADLTALAATLDAAIEGKSEEDRVEVQI